MRTRLTRVSPIIRSFALLGLLLFLAPTPVTHAATYTVTNLNDSGAGSLRQAILDANATAAADTITFSVSGTITLGSLLPDIAAAGGALTIDGAGQTVTISGNNNWRVFFVDTGATLNLRNLTVANGNAPHGGGIYNAGTVTVTNSTFSGNRTMPGTGGGGGIENVGTLTVTNSAFSGNDALLDNGGGIFNRGTVTVTNSTFSGNSGSGGGGIYTDAGTLTVTNSTFSGNRAGDGGGIYQNSGAVTLRNTIVANSTSGGNCFGTITNGSNNIDSGTTCGWGSTNGSMSSTNPLLGPLANNGGPTQTMALLVGSLAIDGVTYNAPNNSPATDQRGVARPQGARYDIGAYELQQQQPAPAPAKPAEVPEADTLLLLGSGVGGLGVWLRWQWGRRRKG